jgi:S-adenosyl methyltransferase
VSRSSAWGPQPVDDRRANGARVYDYLLGGAHNFAVDRDAARELLAINPEADKVAKSNRQFVTRTVRFCLAGGIDQFLDLGSGVPTVGNVHEIVQAHSSSGRVLYVDNEPVAVETTREMLRDDDSAGILHADLRQPELIFGAAETERLLDFSRPVAVLMNASVHYVPDSDDLPAILAAYRDRMPAGSYLVFSHLASTAQAGLRVFDESGTPMTLRDHDELAELLRDFELFEPGLVWVPEWRPDGHEIYLDTPDRSRCYGAVGRKVS